MPNGFMTPSENAAALEQQRPDIEALLGEMRSANQAAAASRTGPQVLPDTGGQTAEGLLQKKAAELEAQNNTQKIAKAANIFPALEKAAEDIARLSELQSQKIKELEDTQNHTGFFDYVADAWKAPGAKYAVDTVTASLNARKEAAAALNNLVQQSAVTANTVATAVTADTIATTREALGNLNERLQANARIEAARNGIDAINASLNLNDRQLKAYEAQRNMQRQDAADARAEAMHQLSVERETRLNETAKMQYDAFMESKQSDEMMYNVFSAGVKESGQIPIDKTKFSILAKASPEYVKQMVTHGLKVIQTPPDPITGARPIISFGPTIKEREEFRNAAGVTPNTPQAQRAISMQYDAYEKARKIAGSTDKNAIEGTAEKQFKIDFETEQKNIRPGSMFEAPANEVIERSAFAKSNPIWNEIIKPIYTAAGASKSAVDPQLVFDALGNASDKKLITTSQAAQFYSKLFNQVIHSNNAIHQFRKWTGMEQTRFGVNLKLGASTGSIAPMIGTASLRESLAIDAATEAEVQQALGLRIRNKLLAESMF